MRVNGRPNWIAVNRSTHLVVQMRRAFRASLTDSPDWGINIDMRARRYVILGFVNPVEMEVGVKKTISRLNDDAVAAIRVARDRGALSRDERANLCALSPVRSTRHNKVYTSVLRDALIEWL